MVDRATLVRPHDRGGLNCPLVKDIVDSRRVALWMRALYSTEDWVCALKKRVMDETGANATAFIHRRISDTNHAHQIIGAFKELRWAIVMMPSLKDSKSMSLFSQQQATSSILVMTGWRHNQQHHQPQHVDKVLNNTHLMMKYPPWLVDANKWCDNKVETHDVHCALKPLHGSQRTTHIVMSVSKVAWM